MRFLSIIVLMLACGGPAVPAQDGSEETHAEGTQAEAPGTPNPVATPPEASDRQPPPERVSARHIVVAWSGAQSARPTQRRTRDEARTRAEEVLQKLRAGADFIEIAAQYSDGPTQNRGGMLGAFGRGAMHANFEAATFALEEGALSDIVETPFGYHVIKREPLMEIRVSHLLVQWNGVLRSDATRTQDEARARIEEAMQRITNGETFFEVTRTYSDGPTGIRGGDLGWFQKGQMVPAFDDVAFVLAPGTTSEIFESPLGYHIVHRSE